MFRFELAIILTWSALAQGAVIAADEKQPPHNIAVVSLFDNTFHKIRVGVTVFNNSAEEKDVSDWHVPETSEADMIALLKQKGVGQTVAVLAQTGARAQSGRGVEKTLSEAARQAGFDTLVVIEPTNYDNARFLQPGYGVFGSGGLFGAPIACPYGVFTVEVYRTSDADRIDWRWGFSSFGEGPCVGLRTVPWKAKMADYTDEDWATIQAAIHKRISDGMTRALDGLEFQ
jgi:hypothetical protein